jgi:ribose transport system substrate-binding protein
VQMRDRENHEGIGRLTLCLALFVAFVALVAAGCGGGDSGDESSSSSGGKEQQVDTASLEAELDELSGAPSFKAPGPVLDVGTELNGKTAYLVGDLLEIPYQQTLLANLKEATSAVGMDLQFGNTFGSAAEASGLIQKAIGLNADVIFNDAYDPKSITAALNEAEAAGIPVVNITTGDPGLPSEEEKALGIDATSTYCYTCYGEVLAKMAAVNSGGEGEVLMLAIDDIPVSHLILDAFEATIAEACPDCNVTVETLPVARITGETGGVVSSYLLKTQGDVYVVAAFDALIGFMQQAIKQAGAESRVHILTQATTQPTLEMLKKGELVEGGVAGPVGWMTWGAADQAVRLLLGEPVLESEEIPSRYFNPENIKTIDVEGSDNEWYGGVNWAAEYESLWGVG